MIFWNYEAAAVYQQALAVYYSNNVRLTKASDARGKEIKAGISKESNKNQNAGEEIRIHRNKMILKITVSVSDVLPGERRTQ